MTSGGGVECTNCILDPLSPIPQTNRKHRYPPQNETKKNHQNALSSSTYASLTTLPSDADAVDCDHRKMRPSPPADNTGDAALDESDEPSKRKPYSLLMLSLLEVEASDFHSSLCFSWNFVL